MGRLFGFLLVIGGAFIVFVGLMGEGSLLGMIILGVGFIGFGIAIMRR